MSAADRVSLYWESLKDGMKKEICRTLFFLGANQIVVRNTSGWRGRQPQGHPVWRLRQPEFLPDNDNLVCTLIFFVP
jgi:hypothetical protein